MQRQLSSQAQVAKICRQYVKSLGLAVKARSSSFSMGDSVDVTVTDATADQRDMIEKELNQYQYGHFDGMTDMYECSNSRDDIPQTKFEYSDDLQQAAYEWAKDHAMTTDFAETLPELYADADKNARDKNFDFLCSIVGKVLAGDESRWDGEKNISFWEDRKPEPVKVSGNVHEVFHTKKQENIYIVTLPSMERDEFNAMRDHVKSIGGWYSRKWGTSPAGFAFNTRAEAEAFAGGNEPEPANNKMADKLQAISEKAASEAEAKLADRQTNTAKRLAQAMHVRIDGQRLERVATVAEKLAGYWAAGTVPPGLEKYTSKKALVDALGAKLEPVSNGYHGYHLDTGKPSDRADKALWALLDSSSNDNELVKLENSVKFSKIDGYFPTPDSVASLMLDKLSRETLAKEAPRVLEPSAGSGNLCKIAQKQWQQAIVEAFEQNHTLAKLLEAKGFNVSHSDFMAEIPTVPFDVVLMNPPFEKLQDTAHIKHAYSFLKDGGELVAIASAGVTFREDTKSSAFRLWLESVGGTIEALPDGSFKESGTSVNTVLIHITKGN